jgi:hypothetical protein
MVRRSAIDKNAFVEQLLRHATIARFDVAVLHRRAGCDIVSSHSIIFFAQLRIAFEANWPPLADPMTLVGELM